MSACWWSGRGTTLRPSPSSTGATCPASMRSPTGGRAPWRSPRTSPRRPSSRRCATSARTRWRPGGFGPWLFRIASNELVDHYRRTERAGSRRALGAAHPAQWPRRHPIRPMPSDARDAVDELLDAMNRLSPRYQHALALRYLSGLNPDEAAAALGTSKATMAVVVHRASRALRKALRALEDERMSDDLRRRLEDDGRRPVPGPDQAFADGLETRLLAVAASLPGRRARRRAAPGSAVLLGATLLAGCRRRAAVVAVGAGAGPPGRTSPTLEAPRQRRGRPRRRDGPRGSRRAAACPRAPSSRVGRAAPRAIGDTLLRPGDVATVRAGTPPRWSMASPRAPGRRGERRRHPRPTPSRRPSLGATQTPRPTPTPSPTPRPPQIHPSPSPTFTRVPATQAPTPAPARTPVPTSSPSAADDPADRHADRLAHDRPAAAARAVRGPGPDPR